VGYVNRTQKAWLAYLFGAPVGISPKSLVSQTRVHRLSYGVVCVILRLAVLVQYRRVTDRQTDRRTDSQTDTRHSIYRVSIASRGKIVSKIVGVEIEDEVEEMTFV